MIPSEIAAAIRVCRRGPGVTIEPAPLLALADLAVAYLDVRDRWERAGFEAELLGAQRALDAADAALRTALGMLSQQIADGEVTRVPPDPAADRRSPPAGAKVLARVMVAHSARLAVRDAVAALRAGTDNEGTDWMPDMSAVGPLAGAILSTGYNQGLLAVQERVAAQNAEFVALQRQALADDTLRSGVTALLAGDAPTGELRSELRRLIGAV